MARSVRSLTVTAAKPFSVLSSISACCSILRVRRTRKSSPFCTIFLAPVAYAPNQRALVVDPCQTAGYHSAQHLHKYATNVAYSTTISLGRQILGLMLERRAGKR